MIVTIDPSRFMYLYHAAVALEGQEFADRLVAVTRVADITHGKHGNIRPDWTAIDVANAVQQTIKDLDL